MATIAEKYAELKTLGIAQGPDPLIVETSVLRADLTPTGGTFFSFIGSPGQVIIYWHPTTGAHEVYGAILINYLAQGGPIGTLGFPITGEYDDMVGQTSVGRVSDFERGTISWYRATGAIITILTGPVTMTDDYEQVAGIDVSYAQGTINWDKVATQGTSEGEVIAFAYIRATHDDNGIDTNFSQNWTNSAGRLPRGAYHYFRAHQQPDQTRQQLDLFVNTLEAAGGPGELPPMVDVEKLPAGVTVAQAEQSLQFFLSLLEEAFGVRPLIYTYPSFWLHEMNNSSLFSNNYKLWIANYGPRTADGGYRPRMTAPILVGGWNNFTIWQHAVKSGVAGIGTLVDRNQLLLPTGISLQDYLR